ncbi:biopolymer transporter ExbD [candidate division WOR-3 bacterium]|uniref:Biopolymer transporter ExbD n=1 Tax=candidate division WOR-3 bacterium TaxID=2052148 RepID=A0A937XI59_UNCW3|nr:biopolymer transporter ExbD [candidate division WOR-3 bacterium]
MRRRHEEHRRNDGLIVNSLVDIALALVIGFMVAMPIFFENGIFVSAPGVAQAGGAVPSGSDIKANVFLANDGRILLNEITVSEDSLRVLLPRLLDRSVERRVVISNENLVLYDAVVRVMDMAKQTGASDVAWLRTRTAP